MKVMERTIPVLFKKKEDCTGCGACYARCIDIHKGNVMVQGAITMQEDEEGFAYPVIDSNLCYRCYRCIDVCPQHKML